MSLMRWLLAEPSPLGHTEEQSTAALQILYGRDELRRIMIIGNPESEIAAAETSIRELRAWASALPDKSEASAFVHWLDYYQKQCDKSRRRRLHNEKVAIQLVRMSKPPA